MEKILVVGYTTRPIVQSAVRAGFVPYAIDHFLDLDLLALAEAAAPLEEDLPDLGVGGFLERLDLEIDGIVIGSGCERIELEKDLNERIIGNSPDLMRKASDKCYIGRKITDMGFLYPEIYREGEIEFPAVIKPASGGGGLKNILVNDASELEALDLDLSEYLIQAYVDGIPASVSVISTEDGDTASFCVNEQLIGAKWLNAPSRFAYCGNIVPLETELDDEICMIAEEVVRELGLVGSNGVDFVITPDGPVVIEVNPRFQGSLEAIEAACGCNLFDYHMRACEGELPELKRPERFGIRAVVYAPRDMLIEEDLRRYGFSDAPSPPKEVAKGEPLASVVGLGKSRDGAVEAVKERLRGMVWCPNESDL